MKNGITLWVNSIDCKILPMYLNSSEPLAIMWFIHCLQTVWNVMMLKSPFPSPYAITLLDMKNDTILHSEKELVMFMKHNNKKTEWEVIEWKFCTLKHTLIFMFILCSFVFIYIHIYSCVFVCVSPLPIWVCMDVAWKHI